MTPSLDHLRQCLAPRGTLRAAINLSNTLLVSSRDASGGPMGLAPSVVQALGARLEVPVALTPFATPAAIVDQADADVWDVALLGAEHARKGAIAFTPPYALIEATYLVRDADRFGSIAQVDSSGARIAAPARTAYGVWLERNLSRATLVTADGLPAARDLFANRGADALAGLRHWLLADQVALPDSILLPGAFLTVEQAIGYRPLHADVTKFLGDFIAEARAGLIARLMALHGVKGVTAA